MILFMGNGSVSCISAGSHVRYRRMECFSDSTSLWVTCAEKTGGRSADECLSAPSQGMLLEPRPSLSTDMDLTSSSTQRTSEATCSARTS